MKEPWEPTESIWHKWKDPSYRQSVLWGGTNEQRKDVIKRRDAARNAQHDKEDPQVDSLQPQNRQHPSRGCSGSCRSALW